MTKKCICQICNCGRHSCPHRAKLTTGNAPRVDMFSEYHVNYKEVPIPQRESYKPTQSYFTSSGPIGKTINKTDFVPHCVQLPERRVPTAEYIKPGGLIDTLTTYKQEYVPQYAERIGPYAPTSQYRPGGKFDGLTTNKVDYVNWCAGKPERAVREVGYFKSDTPMDSRTINKTDFVPHPPSRRDPFTPIAKAFQSDIPLEGKTMYRVDYVPKHLFPCPAQNIDANQCYRFAEQIDGHRFFLKVC